MVDAGSETKFIFGAFYFRGKIKPPKKVEVDDDDAVIQFLGN